MGACNTNFHATFTLLQLQWPWAHRPISTCLLGNFAFSQRSWAIVPIQQGVQELGVLAAYIDILHCRAPRDPHDIILEVHAKARMHQLPFEIEQQYIPSQFSELAQEGLFDDCIFLDDTRLLCVATDIGTSQEVDRVVAPQIQPQSAEHIDKKRRTQTHGTLAAASDDGHDNM